MISLKFKAYKEKYKITLMAIFLTASCYLTYYFHAVLNRGTVFSHIFYIPIILASLWWKRKGLIVAIFLAVMLTLSHIYMRADVATANDYFRAVMFIIIAVVVSTLREHIAKTEKALRDSEERYRTTFENTGTAMSIGEEDTTISLVNKMYEKLSGHSKEEIEGKKSWTEFVTKEDLEKLKTYHNERRKEGGSAPNVFEYRFADKNGDIRNVLVNTELIPGTKRNISSLIDITEYKRSEELAKLREQQLIQAEKMATIGILATGVAHEINNPNNFILLNGKMLSKVWKDIIPILEQYYENNGEFALAGIPYTNSKEKISQLISGISEGSVRIKKIVKGLKDFAYQDKGNLKHTIDINSVVESSILIVNNLIKKSTNCFSVNYGKNIPAVNGNFQQLEQVVINLISNSCQALIEKEKSLIVSTSHDKDSDNVIIKVHDEGTGISNENLKHVFDPFFSHMNGVHIKASTQPPVGRKMKEFNL